MKAAVCIVAAASVAARAEHEVCQDLPPIIDAGPPVVRGKGPGLVDDRGVDGLCVKDPRLPDWTLDKYCLCLDCNGKELGQLRSRLQEEKWMKNGLPKSFVPDTSRGDKGWYGMEYPVWEIKDVTDGAAWDVTIVDVHPHVPAPKEHTDSPVTAAQTSGNMISYDFYVKKGASFCTEPKSNRMKAFVEELHNRISSLIQAVERERGIEVQSTTRLCPHTHTTLQPTTAATAENRHAQTLDEIAADEIGVIAINTWDIPPSVSGDPFTTFDGKKTQFFLAPHEQVSLATCNDIELQGRVMPSTMPGDRSQWFDKLVINLGGRELVSVTTLNAAALIPSDTKQVVAQPGSEDVDVAVGQMPSGETVRDVVPDLPLTTVNVSVAGRSVQHTLVATAFGNASISISRVKAIGLGYSEVVDIAVGSTNLAVQSALANKFTDANYRMRHLHLDLSIRSLDVRNCVGTLPEIWGVKPMSAETAKMLQSR